MMDICVDFDGTCVFHKFPSIGADAPHAEEVLKELVQEGHNIILWTMRSDGPKMLNNGKGLTIATHLSDAVKWFNSKDIPLYGIQENPTQKKWTNSPKAYGHIYIDDAALGCPLLYDIDDRAVVDWLEVRRLFIERGIL